MCSSVLQYGPVIHLSLIYFFFNVSAPTQFYPYAHPLSLHDALPICDLGAPHGQRLAGADVERHPRPAPVVDHALHGDVGLGEAVGRDVRSEEHTSELQSLMRISYAVFCLTKKNTSPSTRYDEKQSELSSPLHNTNTDYTANKQ